VCEDVTCIGRYLPNIITCLATCSSNLCAPILDSVLAALVPASRDVNTNVRDDIVMFAGVKFRFGTAGIEVRQSVLTWCVTFMLADGHLLACPNWIMRGAITQCDIDM
jgi:hypothetical protein